MDAEEMKQFMQKGPLSALTMLNLWPIRVVCGHSNVGAESALFCRKLCISSCLRFGFRPN